MSVQEHYDDHLAHFYSWMMGDIKVHSNDFYDFLVANRVFPFKSNIAIDLGAGNGIQSFALNTMGFDVIAIDFCNALLDDLETQSKGKHIKAVQGDIRNIKTLISESADVICCCGDTLTHLNSIFEVETMLNDAIDKLNTNGTLILSFRDYTKEVENVKISIPVKSDANRVLTCILEYEKKKVKVTDLFHENQNGKWNQSTSSYAKIRLAPKHVISILENHHMNIAVNKSKNGFVTLLAKKQP